VGEYARLVGHLSRQSPWGATPVGLKVPDLHWVGWPMNWEQATVTGLGAKGLLAHSHDGAVTRCPLLLFLACITRYAAARRLGRCRFRSRQNRFGK